MKYVPFLFLSFFASLSVWVNAQNIDTQTFDKIIQSKVDGLAPGLAVGIVQNGKVIYEKYTGYANLEHAIKVDQKSQFNIASNAKQFTALCILQLALDKKLNLDDDIRKYLPDFYPNIEASIRIRHLLTHSSGIRDFYDLLSMQGKPWWAQTGLDNQDALQLLLAQTALNFEPGTSYLYSNSNYTLLTEIVQKASGISLSEYVIDLFKKLGLENSQYATNYMAVIPHKTSPYSNWGDGVWQKYPSVVELYGDGFLFTTLKDQLIWEQALQKNIDSKLLAQSQAPIQDNEIKTYGFGVEFDSYKGYDRIQHAGSTGSYGAQFVRFPAERLAIVVMSNNGNVWSGGIANELADLLLPKKSIKITSSLPDDFGKQVALDLIKGNYESKEGEIISISKKEAALFWKSAQGNELTLVHEQGNLYHALENEKLQVLFSGTDNQRIFTVYYPGTTPRVHPIIPFEACSQSYYTSLNGTYQNTEIDVTFKLEYKEANQYTIHIWDETLEAQMLVKNHLVANNFQLKVIPASWDMESHILVEYNRVKNLKFIKKDHPKVRLSQKTSDGGKISVATTKDSYGQGKGDILLTKTNAIGNEEWFQSYGGTSYDIAGSVQTTQDGGYIIVGSTSSFGKGNYDIWLIKTDVKGKREWSKTYGGFSNEYGYAVRQRPDGGYLIKGTKQLDSIIENDILVIQTDQDGVEEKRKNRTNF